MALVIGGGRPPTGQRFCLSLPRPESAGFEGSLHEWRRTCPAAPWAVVPDHSGAHPSARGRWPDGMEALRLPAYSPELNPGERWFKALRRPRAHHVHDSLESLEPSRTQALRPDWEHPWALVQLTAYPWWRRGVEAIMTSAE